MPVDVFFSPLNIGFFDMFFHLLNLCSQPLVLGDAKAITGSHASYQGIQGSTALSGIGSKINLDVWIFFPKDGHHPLQEAHDPLGCRR
ncbi:MAG: hypothetical protein OXC61_02775, partial [Flavobacteriaceae bacterium]|nr:hypothetical protein [Flavobacteriaceae bacterium]